MLPVDFSCRRTMAKRSKKKQQPPVKLTDSGKRRTVRVAASCGGDGRMVQNSSASSTFDPDKRIVTTPEVCGGEPRIAGTRMPVRILAAYREQGSTDAELLRDFPYLKPEDLAAAWIFVDNNPDVMTA
jgi:uncharacterized protein (DUF433 family)